ncbi:MAG: hypothetical protein QW321_00785 [Candidatus Aenigmatarchaeota archaeon]
MKNPIEILKEIKFVKKLKSVFSEKRYILITTFFTAIILFLYSFSMGLITIPIFNVESIRIVSITIFDIIYMVVFSLISGITIALYWYSKKSVKGVCTLSGGILAGFLTSICPSCPILLLALIGTYITLEFLAPYFPFLRILSLSLLLLSLYWLSKSIKNGESRKPDRDIKRRIWGNHRRIKDPRIFQ